MDKLWKVVSYLSKLDIRAELKVNGMKINHLLVIILMLLGIKNFISLIRRHVLHVLWNTLESGWRGGLHSLAFIGGTSTTTESSSVMVDNWPSMKQLFRSVFRKKNKLLDASCFAQNNEKHVILYGACSHMGQTCARVMLKYGYSLILVDANLHKLQMLQTALLRQFID